jgi:hypothetical protein
MVVSRNLSRNGFLRNLGGHRDFVSAKSWVCDGGNRLRKLGDRNQRRVCSQPSHEAEVRMLPRRIAVGSGRRNHFAEMEAALPGDGGRLGFPQPTEEAQSQHIRGAARVGSRSHQIARGRLVTASAIAVRTLLDHFRPQSKNPIARNLMIALVAGGGFEPPTFGL